MKKDTGWGAIVSITNKEKILFFLQQKDKGYWIPEFRFKYCFFGGGINPEEDEFQGLKRELLEEFESEIAENIYKNAKKLFDVKIINRLNQNRKLTLFESILSTEELIKISQSQIKEGKGELTKKQQIKTTPFMSDINRVYRKYFKDYLGFDF